LNIYPETIFDMQNVNEGDTFSFLKESGKVIYSHKMNDPFATNKKIIGTYCIIKNCRGEFIETLNQDDIKKMRNVANTQAIWDTWEGEMILKSVIKRACKRHFNDIVVNIETLDNDNYEPENVTIDSDIQTKIQNCNTVDELQLLYDISINDIEDEKVFIKLMTERKIEIKKEVTNA